MSSADQGVDTGGGTGTGVQTIVKDKVKKQEMTDVSTRRISPSDPLVALSACPCGAAAGDDFRSLKRGGGVNKGPYSCFEIAVLGAVLI